MDFHAEYEVRCNNRRSDIHAHLPTLYHFASSGECQVIELGVRTGESTIAFLAAVTAHGGHVWSCDIASPRHLAQWRDAAAGQWTFVRGDDLAAVESAPDEVDIVFIDTSHTYDQTKAELAAYCPKLRPGGVVLLHDTELQRPADSPPSDPPFPVRVAVEEFADEHGWTLDLLTGCYGLGVLHKPERA